MVEAWVKRKKHVGNEEEASESMINNAIVASLGQSVGGHARLAASESNSLEQKRKMSWRGTVDFGLVT